jgi:alpha/beta superfamily hydrolase
MVIAAMVPQRIEFQTDDDLTLEGELRMPDGSAPGAAVICHPHPQFGGSKDHPLLWAIRIELAKRDFAVLSFNFRGVMGSEGEYGAGVAEVTDVRAAVGRARREVAGPTFVAGWSFGAHVALREAVEDDRVEALALVGIPLLDSSLPPLPEDDALGGYVRPVLLLSGGADGFSPEPELRHLEEKLGRATIEVVPGADHYFAKREREAGRIVAEFAARAIEAG